MARGSWLYYSTRCPVSLGTGNFPIPDLMRSIKTMGAAAIRPLITTALLILAALGLAALVYFREAPQVEHIFCFTPQDVVGLTLTTPQQTLELRRQGPDQWDLQKTPEPVTAANSATVTYLLTLLTTTEPGRFRAHPEGLVVSSSDWPQFGLAKPQAALDIRLRDNSIHTLVLGNPSFDGQFVYGVLDPPPQPKELQVTLVPMALQTALGRPPEDWQAPAPQPESASPAASS